jgi:hypothetical protein
MCKMAVQNKLDEIGLRKIVQDVHWLTQGTHQKFQSSWTSNCDECQLCSALTKFSKSGSVVDFEALEPLLQARMRHEFSVDVSLRVALKVCERCFDIGDCIWDQCTWLCVCIFLRERTYARAEAFAAIFLPSGVGGLAFDSAKQCLEGLDTELHEIYGLVVQFLAYALWHESRMVNVLRTERETYRVAFAFVVNNCKTLPTWLFIHVVRLFRCIVSGRTDSKEFTGGHTKEFVDAVKECIFCGGLSALSATLWAACSRITPTVFSPVVGDLSLCCTRLFALLVGMDYSSVPLREAVSNWCYTESRSKEPMVAGLYALFRASVKSPRMLLRTGHSGSCALATTFIQILRGCAATYYKTAVVEQAIKYPYEGSDGFPLEGTWLFMCLDADRRLGDAVTLETCLPYLLECVQDIPWAVDTIRVFTDHATAKQATRPMTTCAFPGCEVTSTALCPLRKCGRCLAVYYCGPQHQRDHWLSHKAGCVERSRTGVADSCSGEINPTLKHPYFCALPGCAMAKTVLCKLGKCGRCRTVRYCGSAHQQEHWPVHKPACTKSVARSAAPRSTGATQREVAVAR